MSCRGSFRFLIHGGWAAVSLAELSSGALPQKILLKEINELQAISVKFPSSRDNV